jgi:hypothetical protein
MKEEEKTEFLKDFKNADLEKKLDMWYFAIEQEGIWEEILTDLANIAEEQQMKEVLAKMKSSRQ